MSKSKRVQKKNPNKVLCSRFEKFLKAHPPAEFSRHLRTVFFDYISLQTKSGFPQDFDIYLGELYDLFELLDFADDLLPRAASAGYHEQT
jgi:hypothetical protein